MRAAVFCRWVLLKSRGRAGPSSPLPRVKAAVGLFWFAISWENLDGKLKMKDAETEPCAVPVRDAEISYLKKTLKAQTVYTVILIVQKTDQETNQV